MRENEDGEYGIIEASVWAEEKYIKHELFSKDGTLQPMELQFLDV